MKFLTILTWISAFLLSLFTLVPAPVVKPYSENSELSSNVEPRESRARVRRSGSARRRRREARPRIIVLNNAALRQPTTKTPTSFNISTPTLGLFTQFDGFPLNRLLILNRLKGFTVQSKGDQGLESNLLTPLLPPPEYKQAGEIAHRENIYDFMVDLANRYVDLLKEEGEIKQIHVVPIAKVPNESNLDTSRPIILFGVLGKRKGSDNLIGMAGLIVKVK
ncbi:hypothetical protein Ddc_16806 [Ditylenchus destructor]|nr:hypothetical protein Ddc_16806 [Ditylenchus destructor]